MPKQQNTPDHTTIVAIGASAGGLDPYERFFDSTSNDSGLAYVIIQHLSPNFQSMMDELLARHSKMKIERVVDGMQIKPNTIYLNPPRTEMIVEGGTFKLTDFDENKHFSLPIDTFFTSLAEEAGSKAIAIVLSGTGSDGTKGAQAVKDAGGTVFAQDLVSAKFDGMPGSIIKLGIADAIGNPEMLAENVGRVCKGLPLVEDPNFGGIKSPAQRIFQRLRERFGTEFNYYKPATIDRRLERRAGLRNLSMEDYAEVVYNDPAEAEALYGDLLIEVTSFFRDPDAFDQLREKIIPELASGMTKARPVRIWVPGCASGEEAYSIAIMFADYARANKIDLQLKILATDIHHRSLEAASAGIFKRANLIGLSDEQLEWYFDSNEDTAQIKPYLRRMVVFSAHNILKDPPFTRMDLIACRNVLIYFNDIAQQKTLALFHFGLRKSGYLFLGPSETTGKLDAEFSVLDAKWRIYQKKRDVRLLESVSMLPSAGAEQDGFETQSRPMHSVNRQLTVAGSAVKAHNDTLKELLRRYAPPGILLNEAGEIAHVFGDAGGFLKIENGVFSNKVIDLVDDELKMIIATGLERIRLSDRLKFERRVSSYTEELGKHSVVISIETMSDKDAGDIFNLLTITRVKPATPAVDALAQIQPLEVTEASSVMHARIADLERDLQATEESLQSTIEELETSNEELQATNEELMASNEELQSTNEELHSVNEELYTVSTEHQHKIEELMEATVDMDHLLLATDIGIVFLDDQLQIRRFTPSAKKTFNIIPQDVGRPFSHITYAFEDFGLNRTVALVYESGDVFEREIECGDETFVLRVHPYRSSLDEIVGTVITMVDITEVKRAEYERTATTRKYEAIVSDFTDFLLRWSPHTNEVTYANEKLAGILGQPLDEILGSDIKTIGTVGTSDTLSFANLSSITSDTEFRDEVLRFDASGNKIYVSGTVRPIFDAEGEVEALQATGRDVTDQYRYRNSLEKLFYLRETAHLGDEMALIDGVLAIGAEHFNMPAGALMESDGINFRMRNAFGTNPYAVGETVALTKPDVDKIKGPHEAFAFHDINAFEHKEIVVGKGIKFGSSLNIILNVFDEGYGRLAFADAETRAQPFTESELMFLRLLRNFTEGLIERDKFLSDIDYRREHFISIYHQAPIMMCILDADGQVLEANALWYDKLGFSENKTVGKPFAKFVSDKGFAKGWAEYLTSAQAHDDNRAATVTLPTINKDGIICEMTATRLPSPGHKPTQFLISLLDITEQVHSFERIEHQKHELEKANEGLSTFAYVASHDLQEPLRKIRQYVEMLQIDCEPLLDKDGLYYLDVITGSAARISYLVKDILAYTTASNADIEITTLALGEILEDVVDQASNQIEATGAVVTFDNLPEAKGDWGAIKLLFQNLLSNGLKYQEEGATPVLSAKSRELKTKYVIDFIDNGIGIEEIEGKDVFEAFVRLHSKFEYAGTGIGLAICKTVCQRMGWDISHKPNPKGGTIFSLHIPK